MTLFDSRYFVLTQAMRQATTFHQRMWLSPIPAGTLTIIKSRWASDMQSWVHSPHEEKGRQSQPYGTKNNRSRRQWWRIQKVGNGTNRRRQDWCTRIINIHHFCHSIIKENIPTQSSPWRLRIQPLCTGALISFLSKSKRQWSRV